MIKEVQREPNMMDAIRAQQALKRKMANPKHTRAIEMMRKKVPMVQIHRTLNLSPNTVQALKEFV